MTHLKLTIHEFKNIMILVFMNQRVAMFDLCFEAIVITFWSLGPLSFKKLLNSHRESSYEGYT